MRRLSEPLGCRRQNETNFPYIDFGMMAEYDGDRMLGKRIYKFPRIATEAPVPRVSKFGNIGPGR